jgi:hypothetical protein
MRNHLSAAELLSAWERAAGQPPVHQALVLLGAACPERSPDELAALSIGERDGRLLTFRERLFGAGMTSVAVCPRCHQTVETTFDVADIRADNREPPLDDDQGPPRTVSITVAGYRVTSRLPTSRDLAALEAEGEDDAGGLALLRRCLQSAVRERDDGGGVEAIADVRQLPSPVVDAIADQIVAADPQADTRLTLRCPDCDHVWVTTFDIAAYLASEVHGWATRLLREVHWLAHAYGWTEAHILAMTPLRRRAYLELLGLA